MNSIMSTSVPLLLFLVYFGQNLVTNAFSVRAPKIQRTSNYRQARFVLFSASTDESITPTPQSSSLNGNSSLQINGSAQNDTTAALPSRPSSFSPSLSFVPSINEPIDASTLLSLPRHSHYGVNDILLKTEATLKALHKHSTTMNASRLITMSDDNTGPCHERVFANSYVDLGKVDTVGFDYDYTLVTYTDELLELIYDMALKRLVHDRQYPLEMLSSGLQYNPRFPIRGLAVDKETGWICHLSYTHKVSVAWEGQEKVPTSGLYREYRGKRALTPKERRERLKPLNDLFSMAECCLIADTVQFFKNSSIPYCPRNAVTDILSSIRETHISGDFHRIVAEQPERYFRPMPHLKNVLESFKLAGKRLIFVSNSPFWYVDAGMKYVIGENWRDSWDAVITSAGKPTFYTEQRRPFREVNTETGRIKFNRVERFETGKVYTEGCLKELTNLMDWTSAGEYAGGVNNYEGDATGLASPNVLYIGDSLFADLVDAKREFGWTTAAVTPEVGYEMEMQTQTHYIHVERTIEILLNALRLLQEELGSGQYTDEDCAVLDTLERLVSKWRDRETALLGNPFGSVFRARYQPSLFAHSLRRYCDLYMSSVSSLRNYSPQHRFYPEDSRLLSHEIASSESDCWALEDVMQAAATTESVVMAEKMEEATGGDILQDAIDQVMHVNGDNSEEDDNDSIEAVEI